MSKLPDGWRLAVPHDPTCFAQDRPRAFVLYDGTTYGKNRRGVGRGSSLWHRFICNDPKCDARMWVRWDVLANLVSDPTGPAVEPRPKERNQ